MRDALLLATRAHDFGVDESWRKLFEKIARTPAFPADQVGPLLRSFRELFEEGQIMQHCVFSYAHAACAGTVSIWSLRMTRAGREVGRVTIRVVASERAVVEARRRCNHSIQPHERELLQSWASSRGLSLAPGL